jgi:ABC-type Fe3+-hydroxamate transport system substrate-binding protein
VEDLLQRQPDVIVLTVGELEEARKRPGWSQLKAVQNKRLYRMSSDLLVRPTLRSPEAVEQLAGLLHP